jgi:hypothetical protein
LRITRDETITILQTANENGKNRDSDNLDNLTSAISGYGSYVVTEMPLRGLDDISLNPDRELFY